MISEDIEKWRKAGKLARDALNYGKALIQKNAPMLDVTNKIEQFVIDNKGKLAFPTNLAVNNVGAHWTPSSRSKEIFENGDLVKLDVGVHIDGYIGDNALTVEIGTSKHTKMIEASHRSTPAV